MEDPLLGLGDDPSLWHEDSWWAGADLDVLQDDPSWYLSRQGQQYLANRQEQINQLVDSQVHVRSRWEELLEEEEILQCMSNMFVKAEEDAQKYSNDKKGSEPKKDDKKEESQPKKDDKK